MNKLTKAKSTLLFFLLCIPLRALAAGVAYKYSMKPVTAVLAVAYLLGGLQMMRLWLFNMRMNAPEAGGETWWNGLRPYHSILYILFAMAVVKGGNARTHAYIFLVADVLLGVAAWIIDYVGRNK